MPWKGEKDPYKIWISEVILQQTRVDQGLNYYNRFIAAFPSVEQLAGATDAEVFKLWEGLGYYSRCRNLLFSARYISNTLKGKFPDSFEELVKLKGVGSYTAAAIASFAYELPYAVVDGNVQRVLSRIYGVNAPINSTAGKKIFNALAEELLDKNNAASYNQAIMDFGATVCKPKNPLCEDCVFNKNCFAFNSDQVDSLPVNNKKQKIRRRWFYYLVITGKNKSGIEYIIRKRTDSDIWQDLYEFPLCEVGGEMEVKEVLSKAQKHLSFLKHNYTITHISPVFRQQLSHQLITGQFISLYMEQETEMNRDLLWVKKNDLRTYAFPRYINRFLDTHLR